MTIRRWDGARYAFRFASTTEAANEGRVPDEGLSYCVVGNQRFTLRKVVEDCDAAMVGKAIWKKYGRWPVYSKFFDNLGPIPHHMHQSDEQAALVGCHRLGFGAEL